MLVAIQKLKNNLRDQKVLYIINRWPTSSFIFYIIVIISLKSAKHFIHIYVQSYLKCIVGGEMMRNKFQFERQNSRDPVNFINLIIIFYIFYISHPSLPIPLRLGKRNQTVHASTPASSSVCCNK